MSETDDKLDPLKPRTAKEVGERVLGLIGAIGKVHDPDGFVPWLEEYSLESCLSQDELTFVRDPSPPEDSRVFFSWRSEALVSLLWALLGIEVMPPLGEQCAVFEVDLARDAVSNPEEFLSHVRLRNFESLEAMEHHLYHQHWRVRDHRMLGVGRALELLPDDPPIEDLVSRYASRLQ